MVLVSLEGVLDLRRGCIGAWECTIEDLWADRWLVLLVVVFLKGGRRGRGVW
jgi:hypothetical protein